MNTNRLTACFSTHSKTWTILLAVYFLASCTRQENWAIHAGWTDSLIEKIESMKQTAPAAIIPYLDSTYAHTPDRSITDVWLKYKLKANYYSYITRDKQMRHQYIDSMEALLKGKETRLPYQYAQTLNEKGRAYTDENKFSQGFEAYYDGLQFSLRQKDSCALADFNTSMAMIVFAREEYDKAISYLLPAYAQALQCSAKNSSFNNTFLLQQGILNTLGLCYEREGKADSAIYYYETGLKLVENALERWPSNKTFITLVGAIMEGNLGGVLLNQGQYDQAERYLLNNIKINDRTGFDKQDARTAKAKLIDLYLRERRYPAAQKLLTELQQGLLSATESGEGPKKIWIKWYLLQSRFLDSTGQYRQALSFYKRAGELNDSMRRLQSALYKADMDVAFKERNNQFTNHLLKKDAELKTAYLIAAIIIGCILFALILIIWINLKRIVLKNQQLEKINEQKRTAIKALLESERRNAHLMKLVAHDLRGPIGAIASIASVAEQEKENTFTNKELWEKVKLSAEKSLKLAQELLQQPDVHKKEKVDLAALLAYCIDVLQFQFQEKSQKVQLYADSIVVELYQDSFWRVIVNLLSNASKFSHPGTTIVLSCKADADGILISVQDEGIGIPSRLQPFIFDGLQVTQREGTTGEASFGLGLAECSAIVHRQGGDIWVESQEGKGSTFYIHLFLN